MSEKVNKSVSKPRSLALLPSITFGNKGSIAGPSVAAFCPGHVQGACSAHASYSKGLSPPTNPAR